jgi:hypothetical protein
MNALKRAAYWLDEYNITVVYTAGDCNDLNDVKSTYPDAIGAFYMILADLYENRGDRVDSESVTGVSSTTFRGNSRAEAILGKYNQGMM